MGYMGIWAIWVFGLFGYLGYMGKWATWVNGLYGYLGYMGIWVIWVFGLYGYLGYLGFGLCGRLGYMGVWVIWVKHTSANPKPEFKLRHKINLLPPGFCRGKKPANSWCDFEHERVFVHNTHNYIPSSANLSLRATPWTSDPLCQSGKGGKSKSTCLLRNAREARPTRSYYVYFYKKKLPSNVGGYFPRI